MHLDIATAKTQFNSVYITIDPRLVNVILTQKSPKRLRHPNHQRKRLFLPTYRVCFHRKSLAIDGDFLV